MYQFEWDSKKAQSNFKKHGISFEEAQTIFSDEHARVMNDPDHSKEEDRFIILGTSYTMQLLVVCHCYRRDGVIIRIISARRATKREQKLYMEFLK